jgi:multiple sugar transport system substrate-binding protein
VYEPVRKVWEDVATPNRPSYLPFGGGWLVGVSASATGREREAAIDFVKYLASPETSGRVRADRAFPMLAVRGSQVGLGLPDPTAAPGVESRLWADAVSRTLTAARVVPGLRIPQAEGYLADLAKGRVVAVKGEPAEKALQGVAEAWAARTKGLGVERQVWHYRRSLNKLETLPKPPAR